MELDRMLRFTLKSVFLFIIINCGVSVLVPIVASVISNAVGVNSVQEFLGSDKVMSCTAWLVTIITMMWVLWEDSKKNTAYKAFDGINTAITFLAIFVAYFFPVLYIDEARENVEVALRQYYYTCLWIRGEDGEYEIPVMLTAIIGIVPMMATYVAGHYLYVKKHPEIKD